MTETEWLTSPSPVPMLAYLGGRISDRKLRLLAAACCRRIWHLLTDQRSKSAVEIAERYADGLASSEELDNARVESDQAQAEAKTAKWYAEVEANFCHTAEYCAASARLCAARAARAAVSILINEPDGGPAMYYLGETEDEPIRFGKVKEGSDAWVVCAVGEEAHSRAYASLPQDGELENKASAARHSAERLEAQEQAVLVRELFGNPFDAPSLVELSRRGNNDMIVKMGQMIYEQGDFAAMPYLGDLLEESGCAYSPLLHHCQEKRSHVRGCWVIDVLLGKS